MPLNNFIPRINDELQRLFPKGKIHGVAQSIVRTRGTEVEQLPGIVSKTGEIGYVGIDDRFETIIYHKLSQITTRDSTVIRSVGDARAASVNTFSLTMYVFIDETKTCIPADEVYLKILTGISESFMIEPYRSVLLRINSVILNTEQIFAAEYKGTAFKLPATAVLFSISYTIEATFLKGCFSKPC